MFAQSGLGNWYESRYASLRTIGMVAVSSVLLLTIRKLLPIAWRHRKRITDLSSKRHAAQGRYRAAKLELLAELQQTKQIDNAASQRWEGIVKMPFDSLSLKLRNGELTALDVLHAFQCRALQVDLDADSALHGGNRSDFLATSCIVQPIMEAKMWASQLDSLDESQRRALPLFGIPVSVKESFEVQGYESACGYSQLLDSFSERDSLLISTLKACGAIPFMICCVPQTMMTYGSDNPITGRTTHPQNAAFSPGGSSSGDACLASLRGTPLAFGSDLGGSIRVPAGVCGTFGFCCTPTRLPVRAPSSSDLPMQLDASYGPLSSDLRSIYAFLRAVWCPSLALRDLRDYRYPLTEWRDALYESSRPLRIGYFCSNEVIESLPGVRRAIEVAKRRLEKHGHTLVQWCPPRTCDAWLIVREGWAPYYGTLNLLDGDVVSPAIAYLRDEIRMAPALRLLQSRYLRLTGRELEGRMLTVYCDSQKTPIDHHFTTCRKVSAYREEFMQSWLALNLDAVLCPPFATCALPHELMERAVAGSTYSSVFSLMNFCAGVAPVCRVIERDIELGEREWPRVNRYDRPLADQIRGVLKDTLQLPLSVQIAATPFSDEVVLRLLKEVSEPDAGEEDFAPL